MYAMNDKSSRHVGRCFIYKTGQKAISSIKKSIMLLNRALTFSIRKQDLADPSKALEK
jgi:hypothetical protein